MPPITVEDAMVNNAMRAVVLTVDYVGIRILPAIPGYEWFDFAEKCLREHPDLDWVKQYALRRKEWIGLSKL
jgi:hypothetical protein